MTESDRARTVVVTGGSGLIGRELARSFLENGDDVVIADRDEPSIDETEVGTSAANRSPPAVSDALYVETDVSDEASVERLLERTLETFGGVDVLVNCANVSQRSSVADIDVEEWREVVDVNLTGTFLVSKVFMDHLTHADGALVNFSSVHGVDGGLGSAYPASKAAIINLTKTLAVELGPHDVTVNAVCPGRTVPEEATEKDPGSDDPFDRLARRQTLLPRYNSPSDVADLVLFLASDEASQIHGESIFVDGGWTAHRQ
jgi:NAD(P)-dependent dehydrogenase (short-subunit alcohol dehydrogenase family)